MLETNFWFQFALAIADFVITAIKWVATFIIELLRVAAWPFAVFAAVKTFRPEISDLLNRTTKISGPGVGLEAAQQQAAQAKETETKEEAEEKQRLIEELENLRAAKDGLEAEKTRSIEEALRIISERDEELGYERIHNIIFGSQITLLRKLMLLRDGANRDFIGHFFAEVQGKHPVFKDAEFNSVDGYMSFLIRNGLVSVSSDGVYKLTDKGVKYLAYIDRLKYSDPSL